MITTIASLASLKRIVQLTTSPTATRCKMSFKASSFSLNLTVHPSHVIGIGPCSFTQLRYSTTSSVPKTRVCQLCRKRDYEGGQHHECGVQSEAQHGAHHHQGSVCRWQCLDRGHVTRPVRCKFVTSGDGGGCPTCFCAHVLLLFTKR